MAYVGTPIDTTNQFQSLQGKRFSGNGSTTAFTLDVAPGSTLDIEVFVENVRQDPNSAYSLSGTTLTFSAAPSSGTNNIYVIHQAKAVGTITAGAGTVNADSFDNTVISGHTALTSEPADTDEFLVSDAGTIKRVDYSYIKAANTPAFLAKNSANLNMSDDTITKVNFDTEDFDSDGNYDHSSNYRFTPQTAGKYMIYAQAFLTTTAANAFNSGQLWIYKNGSQLVETNSNQGNNFPEAETLNVSSIVTFNGSSDYVEIYARLNSEGSVSRVAGGSIYTWFYGYKIIGA